MPVHPLKGKNAPLFPATDPEISGIKASWEEPLLGPEDSHPAGAPAFSGEDRKRLHQRQSGKDPLVSATPPFPPPLQDSDAPVKATLSPGTKDAWDTGGVV